MSQIELSRRTGIATSTISDWRKKKINPQADKLVSICKALDMSLAELLCDEEVVERTIEPDFMVDGQNIIELLRTFDFETKRRILRYFELIEICREINRENSSQKIKRNVSVIQDIDGNNIVMINDIRFKGKRSVDRKDVREYLKEYVGEGKEVKELREKMGMNRREFSDYYGIPYRTVQDWEAEKRELPEYLLRLLNYRAEIECRIERVDK